MHFYCTKSSLDTMSERYVKRMIAKLASLGKTVISIAHRFSTIMDAKHIILLAKDKVVAEGTHQELLKTSEDYRKLWSDQNDEIDRYLCRVRFLDVWLFKFIVVTL